ncbi:Abscisic acid 8'-hydroxylase CYP707A1 [Linum grandiflorum]
MTMILGVIFLLTLFGILTRRILRQSKLNMPPGSMGWPVVGETLRLYSDHPDSFFFTRQARYGEIFKSHILGCPCVMLASPEAIRFVMVSQSMLFKPTYPPSKERLIGPSALFFHQGSYHSQIKKLVQEALSLDVIKHMVPHIDSIAISALESWSSSASVVSTFHQMKQFTFDVAVSAIFGQLGTQHKEKLKINYFLLDRGYNCLPLNFPSSLYRKSLMAREMLSRILHEIIKERKQKMEMERDLLGYLLNFEQGALSETQISDNIIGVLFAAQDTTASILTWILKYLHENLQVLDSVKEEQIAIYRSNEEGKRPLAWSQTRQMVVTNRVIMESMRMASIISFTFREAVADVEYKGFLIPKGWKVLPLFRSLHHNPDFFLEPRTFDPSRFQTSPRPNTFIPFGKGDHSCPGNELAKLEMLILIHHLVTKFRYKVFNSGGKKIEYSPFPIPEQGLPAMFWKVKNTNESPLL